MKRQVIAVLTAMIMAVAMIPAAAFASSQEPAPGTESTAADPVAEAVKSAELHEVALANGPAKDQVTAAVDFIKTTDTALEAITDKAAWTAAKAGLEAQLQEIADTYRTKVNALSKDITLDDMAAVQEVYLLKDAAGATAKLDTAAQTADGIQQLAQSKIEALKAKIPAASAEAADKDVFTKKVSQQFAVKSGKDFDFTRACKAELDLSAAVFAAEPTLAGVSIRDILNTGLSEYDLEKTNYDLAKKTYDTKAEAAKAAAQAFISEVKTLAGYDVNKADYNLKLNKAKEQYQTLDAQYRENGILYKDPSITEQEEALKSVRDAREKLDSLIKEATSDNAAILRELVEGIDKLPADVTLADREAVYALQKRVGDLTEAGKETFKKEYTAYADKLDAAVKKMDELVTGDVKQKIASLKALPANPSLKDIQSAKEANAAARAAYEELTDDQKKLVTNETALKTAETAAFTAEAAYVKAEILRFSKLDASNMTEDEAASILDLQELIDGMEKTYRDQVAAETAYKIFEGLVKAADVMLNQNVNLANAKIDAIPDKVYTGKAIKPEVTVKDVSDAVVDPANYEVTFEKNINVGTATVMVTAKGDAYIGGKTATFVIKPASLKKAAITVSNKTYTGKAIKAAPVVKLGKNTLPKTDYKVVKYTNNTKLGKATLTIKGNKNCPGTVSKTFLIKPAKPEITLLRSKAKKQLTISVKEQKTATYYKVYYDTRGQNSKTATFKKHTMTLKKLKSGKVYNVRVRVCKKIDGKNYWGAFGTVYKTPRIR